MLTKWKRRGEEPDEAAINALEGLGEGRLAAKILAARGITDLKKAKDYLKPSLKSLHNPLEFPDMEKAVERIIKALESGEQITIYADYDADGTIAAAILLKYLEGVGGDVGYYIPNRLQEGYGMNIEALKLIADQGTDLLITVDNGIAAIKEAEYLKSRGIDLIVTDHHEPHERLPEALAILDAKRADSKYPFNELCGAGVAFKLVEALEMELDTGADLLEYLQMAAVSTVADIVPLIDENRTIVKHSLESINQGGFIHEGLYELYEKTKLTKLTAGDIGFRIGPMINAPGRLGEVEDVMKLLLSDDPDEIDEYATLLYEKNQERMAIERRILERALEKVKTERLYMDDIIVISGEGWHSGVIGIVASRIQEVWNKPVIIMGIDTKANLARGSARSIPGFNIFEALSSVGEVFESYGGHEQAAGLSIKPQNIPKMREGLKAYTSKLDMAELFAKTIYYDAEVAPQELTLKEVAGLEAFEPTGVGNPGPTFKVSAKQTDGFRLIGSEGKHIGFYADGVRCVAFGKAEAFKNGIQSSVDFLAKPEINCYNNVENVQLKVKDMRENPFNVFSAAKKAIRESNRPEDLDDALREYGEPRLISRKILTYVYNLARKAGSRGFEIDAFTKKTGEPVLSLAAALEILREAKLLEYRRKDNVIMCRIIPSNEKKDLTKTRTYRLLSGAAQIGASRE